MEAKPLPPGQTVSPSVASDSLESAGANVPVANLSGAPERFPTERGLEVHAEGQTGGQAITTPTIRSVPFSRRRATIVSLVITLIVLAITGATAALFINRGATKDEGVNSNLNIPEQDISVGDESAQLPELEGVGNALLVNGNIIARGNLEVVSGNFTSVLRSSELSGDQELILPDASGTICLDVNNCNFATQDQIAQDTAQITEQAAELAEQAAALAALQAQLNQIVIPPAGVTSLNDQAGAVSIQGTLNQISVSTADGVITLTTPQNLDANANVQFNNLTLGGQLSTNTLQQTAAGNDVAINAGNDDIIFTVGGRTFQLPTSGPGAQTICTTSVGCGGGGGGSVDDVNGLTGSITLQGTTDQVTVTTGVNTITFSTPQNINTTSSPTFAGLTLTTALGVASGGTGIATAPTNGQLLIGNGTGYTLATLGNGGGLSITNGAGSISLAVNYGSAANTAVQGNTALVCASGVGNLSGGGNAVTLGAGGSCNNISIINNPTFSTSVTTPSLILTGAGNSGSLQVANLGQATTYTLPDPGQAAVTICLSTGNCAGAGGGITGSGTTNTIPLFTGSQAIGNSIITQTGTTINIGGSLTLTNALTVGNGGTGGTTFTSNGVIYGNGTGALQATAAPTAGQVLLGNGSGVPTFTTLSGDVTVNGTGVTAISPNSVALGVDTTGDYVANLGALTGLSTTGNSGEGSTPTLSVLYGSTANTAVQGNTALTCPSGTGNLTGGGTAITLGTGGACASLSTVQNPTFTTSVTTPNLILTGAGNAGTLEVANLGQATTYTLPDPGQATADICLSTGNCVGGGGSAPNNAEYLVVSLNGTLSNERALAAGSNITFTDGGANNNFTIATIQNPTFSTSVTTPLLTSTGALNITPGGALTVGAAGQTTVLQGSTTSITSNGANNDITLTSADQVIVNSTGTIELQDNTNITGTLAVTGAVTGGTYNGQTISSAASFTGTVAVATSLTTPLLQSTGALNITPGGALTVGVAGQTALLQGSTLTLTSNGANNDITLTSADQIILNATGTIELQDSTNITGSLAATGTGSFQGASVTIGAAAQAGSLILNDGSSNTGTLQLTALGQNTVYNLPDPGQASVDICLTTGNCAGSGGGITGSGTTNRVAKFTGSGTIGDSTITDDGTNVSITGDFTLQGGDITVGTGSQIGSLVLHDGNGQTTTVRGGDSTGNLVFILPTAAGATNQCIKQSGTANQLYFDNCDGGGGGSSATLQQAYNNGNTINTTNARDIAFTLSNDTTDSNFVITIADDATGNVQIVRVNGTGTNNPAQLLLLDNQDASQAIADGLRIQSAGGGITDALDLSDAELVNALNVGDNTILGTAAVIDFTNFDVLANGNTSIGGTLAVTGAVTGGTYNGQTISSAASFTGTLSVAGATTLQSTLTVQGASATIGGTAQQGSLILNDGSANTGTLQTGSLGQNTTYTLPDPGQAAADICLSTGNCIGTGGGAPNNAEYLVVSLNGTLTNDRALTAGANITFTDGGANNNFTIATIQNPTFTTSVTTPTLTSTGALAITPGGALTVGATGQTALLQGSTTTITATGANNDITLTSADQIILNAGGTIELQDNTNITGTLAVTGAVTGGTYNGQTISSAASLTGTLSVAGVTTLQSTLAVQGASATIGGAAQQGSLILNDGSSNTGTLQTTALGQNTVYSLPDPGQATADICLSTGNCVGGTGGAPNNAEYLVVSLNGTLTNERALAAGSNITFTDGGAGGTFSVATIQNPTFTTSVTTPSLLSSGALSIASAGADNDITVDGADQFIVQDVSVFNEDAIFNNDVDAVFTDLENLSIGSTVTGTNSVSVINALMTNNSSSGTQTLALLQNAAGTGTTEGLLTLNNADGDTAVGVGLAVTGIVTTGIDVSDPAITNALLFGANDVIGTNFTIAGASGAVTGGTYNGQTISSAASFTGTLSVAGATTLQSTLAVQGASATIGTTAQQGSVILHDGNGQTATISVGSALAANTALAIPTGVGVSDTFCLLTLANCGGDGGVTSVGVLDSQTKSANGAVITGTSLIMQTADASFPGLVSTGTQTFAGAKTFNGQITAAAGISLGSQTLSGTTAVIDLTNFDVASDGDTTIGGSVGIGTAPASTDLLTIQSSSGLGEIYIQGNNEASIVSDGSLYLGFDENDDCGICEFAIYNNGTTEVFGITGINARVAGSITSGSAAQQGSLVLHDGNGQTATISVGSGLAANTLLAIPTGVAASDTFCLLTLNNCPTGVSGIGTIDSQTKSANGAVISGSNLILQTADASFPGLVSTGTQTFAGAKTFNGQITAAGGINLGTQTLVGTTSVIDFSNFDVASTGSVTIGSQQTITLVGGTTAQRPGSPTEGMMYFDSTTDRLLTYANGKWQGDRTTASRIVAASDSSQIDKDAADYVADGTGDQTEINAALTAAAGGQVYLMPGTYTISASVSIPDNTTLAGSGRGTLVQLADLDTGIQMIRNTSEEPGTGVVVRDMRLDGRKDLNTAGEQIGVYFINLGDGTDGSAIPGGRVTGLWVEDFRNEGIYLWNSDNTMVTNNVIQNGNGNGMKIYRVSQNNTVSDNRIQGNVSYGLDVEWDGMHNTITGNTFQDNGSAGLRLYDNSSNNTVTGNVSYSNTGAGFEVSELSVGNTLTGNTSRGNTGAGIFLNILGDSSSANTTVTGNTITENAFKGIDIFRSNDNTISGNKFHDNGGATTNDAIYFNNSDGNTVNGNDITDTSCSTNCYAINVSNSTSSNNYLDGNTLGTGTINDVGTGTIYGSQVDGTGGILVRPATKTSTTGATEKGLTVTVADTGIVTTGTDTTYGQQINVTRTGATGGTVNTYGLDIQATGDAGGTSTLTGLNVAVSGADTNYAAIFQGGNVGIGDVTPDALLDVAGSFQFDGNGIFGDASTDTVTFNAEVASHIIPDVDDTYDLGSTTNRWREVYIGPASLHIGTDGDEGVISYNTSTNTFQFNQAISTPTFRSDTATFGVASTTNGVLTLQNATNAFTVSINAPNQTVGSATISLPDTAGANDTFCLLTLNNCGGGSGVTTIGTIDSQTKSANGAVISGTSLILQTADVTFPGLVNTGTQTFAGAKTFNGVITAAAAGTGLSVTNNASVGGNLAVTGTGTFTGDVAVNGGDLTATGALNITPSGTLTLGVTGQAAILQGSTTTITSNGANNDITLTSADQIMLNSVNGTNLQTSGTTVASFSNTGTMEIIQNGFTTTGISQPFILIDGTINKDNAIESFYAMRFGSTINVSANPSVFGGDTLFRDDSTRVLNTAPATTLADDGGHITFMAVPTVRGEGGGTTTVGTTVGTNTGVTALHGDLFLATADSSTLTVANAWGTRLAASNIGAGATVTNRYGVQVENAAGAGALTNQYGVMVDALTKGTNNAGLLIGEATGTNQANLVIGQTTVPSGSYSIYNSSTDQNYFAGNLGVGDSTPDGRLDVELASTSTTAGTERGVSLTVSDTGVVTTGTDITYGQQISVTRTGPTGGTINNFGLDISVTGSTGGTSTNTGLNVSVSGADTNYAALFQGGNVGIGDTTPVATFTVGSGDLFQVAGATGNTTTSGDVAVNGGDVTSTAAALNITTSNASGTIALRTNSTTRLTVSNASVTTTVPVLVPDGQDFAPGFGFSGDTDTGIYRPGADLLAVVTAGAERVRFGNTYRVEIQSSSGVEIMNSGSAFDLDIASREGIKMHLDEDDDDSGERFDIVNDAGASTIFSVIESADRGIVFIQGWLRLGAQDYQFTTTQTLEPLASYVEATCNTGGGCTLSFNDATSSEGQTLFLVNNGANTITVNDVDGQQELSATPFVMGQYDTLMLIYTGDRWVEYSRSDNEP